MHEQNHQVLQGLERLGARHQHDERSDVAGRDDQDERQRQAQERLRVPRLPLPAESPPLADAEGKAAEGADGQDQADEITESPPHLQQREGDGLTIASSHARMAVMFDRGHTRAAGVLC